MRLLFSPVDRIAFGKQAPLEFRGSLGSLHQKRVDLRRSPVVHPRAAREFAIVEPIGAPVGRGLEQVLGDLRSMRTAAPRQSRRRFQNGEYIVTNSTFGLAHFRYTRRAGCACLIASPFL